MHFGFCQQYNANFRPLILHRFWPLLKQKTWIGVRMRTPVKNFWISAQEIFQVPKTAKNWHFWGMFVTRVTAQTVQFRPMGIVSVTRRHPKAVCFVSEFWWETYGLGAISQRKQQISAISAPPYFTVQRHSPGVDTLSSSLYYIHSGGGGYISQNLNGSGWNLEYKWGVTMHTHTKIRGNCRRGCT